jgi:hypothetical protein
MTASTTPHARLQPIMPTSSSRTSSRPAVATLRVPVNVSAMIRPNSTSDIRSTGSRTRSDRVAGNLGVDGLLGAGMVTVISRANDIARAA